MTIQMWANRGGVLSPTSPNSQPKLEKVVYILEYDMMSGPRLVPKYKKFELPERMYDIQPGLAERIVRTHLATKRSVGVLLRGLKGAGKTVTAKQVCNLSNLPVIVVNNNNPAYIPFIAQIAEPCVIFIDEFEKHFRDDEDEQIGFLSLMDGAVASAPHIYLLTMNETAVNTNFIDRPGRVRYSVSYRDLPASLVEEIIDDMLVDPTFREDILEYLKQRYVLSVDSVKSVVEEVNIHKSFDVKQFGAWFNLSKQPVTNTTVYDNEGTWKGILSMEQTERLLPKKGFAEHSLHYTGQLISMGGSDHQFVQVDYNKEDNLHKVMIFRNLNSTEEDTLRKAMPDADIYDLANSERAQYSALINPKVTDPRLREHLAAYSRVFIKFESWTLEDAPSYHYSYES